MSIPNNDAPGRSDSRKGNSSSNRFSERRNDNSNRKKENYVIENKHYSKDCTIRVERLNTRIIGERIIIEEIEKVTGLNTVLAVVENDSSSYDVTMDSKALALRLSEGIEIAGRIYPVSLQFSDIVVVSFMKLPVFIDDDEIVSKLESKGVTVVSPVYRRTVPGTQVADGTRFMRCKFPPGITSLL